MLAVVGSNGSPLLGLILAVGRQLRDWYQLQYTIYLIVGLALRLHLIVTVVESRMHWTTVW